MQDSAPAAPSHSPSGPKTWQTGTLTYTKGGLAVLFGWLLWGDFAWAIRDRSAIPIMQILLKKFEVSDTVAAIMIGTLPASFALVIAPIVSYLSDRHRGPRGRRIPYLIFSAPLGALALVGLGLSPMFGEMLHRTLGQHSPGLYPSIVLVLAVWWTVFDFAITITNAVFTALINDVVPAPVIGRFYGLFRAVSLLVGMGFNFWLIRHAEHHSMWIFLAVGVIYGIGVTSMCYRVREGQYPPPPPATGKAGAAAFFAGAAGYFRTCFTKRYYLWFFAAYNIALLAPTPFNLFSVFYAKSVGMSMATYGKIIVVTYGISLVLTYVLGSMADRFHPLRVGMVTIGLYGAVALCGGLFAHNASTYGWALLLHGVLSGAYFTGAAALGQRLLPQATFAEFMSANGIIGGLLNVLMPPVLGYVLDLSHHDYSLTLLSGGVIALLALACLAVVHRYWQRLGGQTSFTPP